MKIIAIYRVYKNIKPVKYLKNYTLDREGKKNMHSMLFFNYLSMRKLANPLSPTVVDGGQLLNFMRRSWFCYISLEKSFQDENFHKSSFVMQ